MRIISVVLSVLVLVSCQSVQKEITPKEKFDDLEQIFSIANWKVINGNDTSFLYFSRMGDQLYHVYDFRVRNGDSTDTRLTTIRGTGTGIIWVHQGDSLLLAAIDSTHATWNKMGSEVAHYEFQKYGTDSILLRRTGGQPVLLVKTLPLATFLVRSHYDFLNGTHTVDSPMVPHRGPELQY